MYVIVLESFRKNEFPLYYNIKEDSWTPQIEYATKIKSRGYANVLKEMISFRTWCRVEEIED